MTSERVKKNKTLRQTQQRPVVNRRQCFSTTKYVFTIILQLECKTRTATLLVLTIFLIIVLILF